MSNYYSTFYLFSRPSFTEGVARVLDLGGTLQSYNEHKTPEQADFEALRRDWQVIGKDIEISIKKYEQTRPKSK